MPALFKSHPTGALGALSLPYRRFKPCLCGSAAAAPRFLFL